MISFRLEVLCDYFNKHLASPLTKHVERMIFVVRYSIYYIITSHHECPRRIHRKRHRNIMLS